MADHYSLTLSGSTTYPYCAGSGTAVSCEADDLELASGGAYTARKIVHFADLMTGFEFHDTTVVQGRFDLLDRCNIRIDATDLPNGVATRHGSNLTFSTRTYTAADSSAVC